MKIINFIRKITHSRIIIKELQEYVNFQEVDAIYVRYKLNFPEKILLTAFPEANIHMFEDGFGDYIDKYQYNMDVHVRLRLVLFVASQSL